jgi:hypothetical protein
MPVMVPREIVATDPSEDVHIAAAAFPPSMYTGTCSSGWTGVVVT